MKFLVSQLTYFISQPESRRNVRALVKYVLFVAAVIALNTIGFHFLMLHVEGQEHSWLTGLYWTVVTMTTLGFGDITFESDAGRLFSVVVLLSGIFLLLIMLPFTFIRYFYAPWLEAQIRAQAPRRVSPDTRGHVIVSSYDSIAPGLIERLRLNDIPYFVLEPDFVKAAQFHNEGISVVAADIESRETYERLNVERARLVFANCEDTTNSNITLTAREVSPDVPIAATATAEDSIDILELSGATHVLPLKRRLGEHLANRIDAGGERAHVIGGFKDLLIAEFPVHNTHYSEKTIREARMREEVGINVVGVWDHGRLLPARPHTKLVDSSVPVVVGTCEQIEALNRKLQVCESNQNPVVIVGGGKVGRAVTRALKRKGVAVHLIEKLEPIARKSTGVAERILVGDAADREILTEAGVMEAPSVVITTNDDAMNIYLAVYCRRLNPELRIISRITHERNLEAIHRAGADFALSYSTLGRETVFALLQGREPVMLGEGVDFFMVNLPRTLFGKTLAESEIGARTGLNVIAIHNQEKTISNPPSGTVLKAGNQLLLIGTPEQRQAFSEVFP